MNTLTVSLIKEQIKLVIQGDVEFEIECLEEDIPIRGNCMASGDEDFDRECEDKIIADLEWNPWAWCCVRMVAKWNGFKGDDYLGGCSYADEADFKAGGYYEDMQDMALDALASEILDTISRLGTILVKAA